MVTVDAEKKLQNRVLHWLIDDLGYTFLGNLEDVDNTPVRVDLLRKHLQERGYTSEQIGKAISELTNEAANQTSDLLEANRAVYDSLRYGLQGVRDDQGNRITVHYIEWDDVTNNDFYVAEEVSVLRFDHMTRKRPDLVLYINGIAVGMIELKRSCVSVGEGIRQMLTNQKKENIQSFFNTMQLLIAGNEAEGLRYGVIETPEKFYLSWKEDKNAIDELSVRIKEIQSKESNRLRDGIVSICQQERFLSLLHDFMIGDLDKSSFNNIEQQSLEFVKYTLDPWVIRIEQSLARALLLPGEKGTYFIKFNVDGLLRGDYQSRMNGYATGRQNGWFSTNVVDNIKNAFSNLASNAWNWGADLIENLISGIGSMIGHLVDKVKDIAGTIASYLHFSEPDVGPLSNFHTFMPDMIKLMGEGIENNLSSLKDPMNSLASTLVPTTGKIEYETRGTGSKGSNVNVDALTNAVLKYLPKMANAQIILDSGTLVGELSDGLNRQLGKAYL